MIKDCDQIWYVDSRATQHMSHDHSSCRKDQKWECGQVVYLGDNTTCQIYGQGHVYVKLNSSQIKNISNVLHVLDFKI
jgi:hypothetical protein